MDSGIGENQKIARWPRFAGRSFLRRVLGCLIMEYELFCERLEDGQILCEGDCVQQAARVHWGQ